MKKLRLSGFALGVALDADMAICSGDIAIYAHITSLSSGWELSCLASPFTGIRPALENDEQYTTIREASSKS